MQIQNEEMLENQESDDENALERTLKKRKKKFRGGLTRFNIAMYMKGITNIARQTTDKLCVYYALNNLIQCCPFITNKHIFTVEDFNLSCTNFRLTFDEGCQINGPYNLKMFTNNSAFSFIPKIDFMHLNVLMYDQSDNLDTIMPKQLQPEKVLKKTVCGTFVNFKFDETANHVITIVALYPYNEHGINNYLYINSHRQKIICGPHEEMINCVYEDFPHDENGKYPIKAIVRIWLK